MRWNPRFRRSFSNVGRYVRRKRTSVARSRAYKTMKKNKKMTTTLVVVGILAVVAYFFKDKITAIFQKK